MNRHTINIRINASATPISSKTVNGRQFMVAPVVPIIVGVHNGSGGPLFYPAEVLSAYARGLSGKPLTLGHPMIGNSPAAVGASPDIFHQYVIGNFHNATFAQNKVKGSVWFDVELTRQKAPRLLERLKRGEQIEVSTGLFSDDEPTTGTWNGEQYQAVVRHIQWDHLAVLPDERGACSLQDGCGIRANTQNPMESFDTSRWLQINAKKIKEMTTMQNTNKIEVLEMPEPYFNAKPSSLELVRAQLVATWGSEAAVSKLQAMTKAEVEEAAHNYIGAAGAYRANAGECCQQSQIVNLKPEKVEAMPLPDYKGVTHGR